MSGENLRRLRLSGFIRLDEPLERCLSLQHLTIHGVTGAYFDQRPLTGMEGISLQSFQYHQGAPLGFELRGPFLASVLRGSHSSLRKLVLLHCTKLPTAALVDCVSSLTSLEYFALSLITTTELAGDFIAALPDSTSTVKLKIKAARYSRVFLSEELALCHSLKRWLTKPRGPSLLQLCLPHVIETQDHRDQWGQLARRCGVRVQIGDWEPFEYV